MKYEQELAALSGKIHGRNAELVRIALLGLRAGRDAVTMQDEIIAAGGEPRLTDNEVNRAINKAKQLFKGNTCAVHYGAPTSPLRVNAKPSLPNVRETEFVNELISAGKGAKSADFLAISAHDPAQSAGIAFLQRIFKVGELVFAGTPFLPRTRENLKTREQLIAELSKPEAIAPTHIVPNPLTGEPGLNSKGQTSYCLDSTIAHRRMALIEFDDLPLEDQAAFWMGAIRTRLLPVRSLVYSGNKSIHGLIELREEADWDAQWRDLERLVCSDPKHRADRSCKNASRFTRFPGAVRGDSHHRQNLLYLASMD